jgi:N-acetyl-anhydromuramyl-L-alanine amidase AmpD
MALVAATMIVSSPVPAGMARADGSSTRPRIVEDHIPYGPQRKKQMAAYSKRHYGTRSWRLTRHRVIVLHFTAGSSYSSARDHFASNAPNRGELPGVCSHYIVDKDGTTYETVAPRIRCRHAIGVNHRAVGIEMVQEAGSSSHWADRQILQRRPQIRAALRLVRYLKARFDVRMHDVIGHAMVNNSRYFKDLEGWRNDHTDWIWRDVKVFRRRLKAMT